MTHNSHVLDQLANLATRLDTLTSASHMASSQITDKINNLEGKLYLVLGKCELLLTAPSIDKIEERVESMERLLFRSSMRDFETIDSLWNITDH